MDIFFENCTQEDFSSFGKNQKKIFRIRRNGFSKKEIKLGYVAEKQNLERRDEYLASEDDNIWFAFTGPVSKREIIKILEKFDPTNTSYSSKIPSIAPKVPISNIIEPPNDQVESPTKNENKKSKPKRKPKPKPKSKSKSRSKKLVKI